MIFIHSQRNCIGSGNKVTGATTSKDGVTTSVLYMLWTWSGSDASLPVIGWEGSTKLLVKTLTVYLI